MCFLGDEQTRPEIALNEWERVNHILSNGGDPWLYGTNLEAGATVAPVTMSVDYIFT